MWPIPPLQNDSVSVLFSSDNLVCCWIHHNQGNKPTIKAYQRVSLHHHETKNLILFNPTSIKNNIAAFMSEHKLRNAFVAFGFDGIREEYRAMSVSSPQRSDFDIPPSNSFMWNYQYLYQNDQGQSVFYIYQIPQLLLLHYKLLAISLSCNLITIMTKNVALFSCYKKTFGTAFRQSQCAVDMMKCNNNIADIITVNMLHKLIHIPAHVAIEPEVVYLATSYGLFINQGL